MSADHSPNPDQEPPGEDEGRLRAELRLPTAIVLTFAGIVLPAICFSMGFPETPTWQSGQRTAYAELLLSRKASLPMVPLLGCCMISLGLAVWRPVRWRDHPLVRLGVFSGVVLAGEYWLVFAAALVEPGAMLLITAGAAVGAVIIWGALWIAAALFRYHLLAFALYIAVAVFGVPYAGVASLFFATSWCWPRTVTWPGG